MTQLIKKSLFISLEKPANIVIYIVLGLWSTQLPFGLRMYNFTFHEQYQIWLIDQSELAKMLWVRVIAQLENICRNNNNKNKNLSR